MIWNHGCLKFCLASYRLAHVTVTLHSSQGVSNQAQNRLQVYKSQRFLRILKISNILMDLYIFFEIYINFLIDLKIIHGVSNQAKLPTNSRFSKI